jgi:hypothetical protein
MTSGFKIAAAAVCSALAMSTAAHAAVVNEDFGSGLDGWVVDYSQSTGGAVDVLLDGTDPFAVLRTAGGELVMSQAFDTTGGALSGVASFLNGSDNASPWENASILLYAFDSLGQKLYSQVLFASSGSVGPSPFSASLDAGSYKLVISLRSLSDPVVSQLRLDGFQLTEGGGDPGSLVPEPASWILMIGGFFLGGSWLRHQRKVAVRA